MNKKILIIIIIAIIIMVGAVVLFQWNRPMDIINEEEQVNQNLEQEEDILKVFYQDVDITPGEIFNAENISEERTLSQIPSCAFEGTDNVSTYSHIEIISAQMDGEERVYSVYFLDDAVETEEGVKITDEKTTVIEKYGDNYEEDGNIITYEKENVKLLFMIENDYVTSIEYVYAI